MVILRPLPGWNMASQCQAKHSIVGPRSPFCLGHKGPEKSWGLSLSFPQPGYQRTVLDQVSPSSLCPLSPEGQPDPTHGVGALLLHKGELPGQAYLGFAHWLPLRSHEN